MYKYFKDRRVRVTLIFILLMIVYNTLIISLVHVEAISSQSALVNYENAYWYSIVTLTTVGYGDLYPTTTYGRAIGYFFVLSSLVFYGLLIGNLTNLVSTFKETRKLGYTGTNFKNHAVIIGWNDYGALVADQLLGAGKQVAIVTNKRTDIDLLHDKFADKKIFTLFSDFKNIEFLEKANVVNSSIVFVNLEDDTEKLVYILNVKKVFPDLEFVVTLDNADLRNTFISAGVTNTISKNEISSRLLASYMFEPDVAQFSESILSVADSESDFDISQFLVLPNNPYVNNPYSGAFIELKNKFNAVLIGISKTDKSGKRTLYRNPMGDITIEAGDYLIFILNGKAGAQISKVFKVSEGYIKV